MRRSPGALHPSAVQSPGVNREHGTNLGEQPSQRPGPDRTLWISSAGLRIAARRTSNIAPCGWVSDRFIHHFVTKLKYTVRYCTVGICNTVHESTVFCELLETVVVAGKVSSDSSATGWSGPQLRRLTHRSV